MGKLFIVTTGLTGILNASLELTRRLRLAGHTVILGAPRPVGDRVAAEGIEFVELPAIELDPAPPTTATSKIGRLAERWLHRKKRRAAALAAYRPEAFLAAVEQLQPDLLLLDVELHEYIIAAYGNHLNFVLLSQWFSLWRRPGLPYLLTDVIPGEGPAGQPDAIDAHWDKVVAQRRRMFSKMALLSGGTDRRSTLLSLAREYNFPLATIRENFWPGVFTYDRFPVLAMTAREMEFPHVPRPHLHYVGPMVHADRQEADARSHAGKPLAEILAEAGSGNPSLPKKLLLCTVSTLSVGDLAFLRNLLLAVEDRPDWCLIIGLGGKLAPTELGSVPDNVHTFAYVPQLQVLRAADLSINHAGIHTIHECLHFGVPMLIYSGKQSDQPGCAARVHYHRLGIMADKDVDGPAEIQAKIELVLTNAAFPEAITQMQKETAHYLEDGRLEHLVADYLRKTKAT